MNSIPAPDAHLHLFDLLPFEPDCLEHLIRRGQRVVSSCHARAEVEAAAGWIRDRPGMAPLVGLSFGIHPQNPVDDEWEFLQTLAATRSAADPASPRLVAIGECGWDFWEGRQPDGPSGELNQDRLFVMQAELAVQAGLPLVIHLRRATDMVFRHARLLAKLPALVFHSWPAPPEEGHSILRHGINAWFSLGTPLLQGNKKAIRSLIQLPEDRLLLETDAPYQTLKGWTQTGLSAMDLIIDEAARLKKSDPSQLARVVTENFNRAFGTWT